MKLTNILLTVFLLLTTFYLSQVSITTSNYIQDFGTSPVSFWTNNSTFTGWYINDATEFQGDINITAATPPNTGGVYIYRCSDATNRKLGTRASIGTGTIHYGLRLRNNTGSIINSITLTYTAYQLSLAENNNNINTNTFSYRIVSSPTTITDLTSGVYTNVTTLNYTAPNNHGGPGTSNQVSGIPCTSSSVITACVPVNIQNNGEIMLRWTDIDNPANDHHLAIDNIQVFFHFDNACAITLPIELLEFKGNEQGDNNLLSWSTASERDNDYFVLEKSVDGINWIELSKIIGAGNSTQKQNYHDIDYSVDKIINYYRLRQVDFNGNFTYIDIISIDNRVKNKYVIKRVNFLGQEVGENTSGLIIEIYSDGTIIKKIK